MIMDKNLQFSSAQAFTTGDNASDYTLDMGVAEDLGIGAEEGEPLTVLVQVDTAFTSAGASTLQIKLQGSILNTGTWFDIAWSPLLTLAQCAVAGAQLFRLPLPPINPDGPGKPRYLRLQYSVATADFTAGKVTAGLMGTIPLNSAASAYPAGFTANN